MKKKIRLSVISVISLFFILESAGSAQGSTYPFFSFLSQDRTLQASSEGHARTPKRRPYTSLLLRRFLLNGDRDKTFGPNNSGQVIASLEHYSHASVSSIVESSDGSIFVLGAGTGDELGAYGQDIFILKLDEFGQKDSQFFDNGIFRIGFNGERSMDARSIMIDEEGGIVFSWRRQDSEKNDSFYFSRLKNRKGRWIVDRNFMDDGSIEISEIEILAEFQNLRVLPGTDELAFSLNIHSIKQRDQHEWQSLGTLTITDLSADPESTDSLEFVRPFFITFRRYDSKDPWIYEINAFKTIFEPLLLTVGLDFSAQKNQIVVTGLNYINSASVTTYLYAEETSILKRVTRIKSHFWTPLQIGFNSDEEISMTAIRDGSRTYRLKLEPEQPVKQSEKTILRKCSNAFNPEAIDLEF